VIIETNIAKRKESIKNNEIRSKGKHLIVFAWGIEIIAASIGLFFAIVRILSAVEQNDVMTSSLWFDALIGALPFVAISLVELTKIPFVTAFYYAQTFVWKSVFFLGIMILMIVTFETFFTGFERSWASINKKISSNLNDMNNLRAEIKTGLENINGGGNTFNLSKESLRENMNIRKNDITEEYNILISGIRKDIDDIQRDSNLDSSPLFEQKEYAKAQIENITIKLEEDTEREYDRLDSNIDKLNEANKINLEWIRDNFDKSQETAKNKIAAIEKRIKSIEETFSKEKKDISPKEVRAYDTYENAKVLAENTYSRNIKECDYNCKARYTPVKDKSINEAKNILDIKLKKIEQEKTLILKNYNENMKLANTERNQINKGQGSSIIEQSETANKDNNSKISASRTATDQTIINLDNNADNQIKNFRLEINSIDAKLNEIISDKDPATTQRIESKKERINVFRLEQKNRLDEIQKEYQDNLDILSKVREKNRLTNKEIEEKKKQLDNKCRELEEKVLTNQVYRLSKLIGGKDIACAEDFYPSLRLTFVIWFGSLSLIIAGTGSLLAMGGLVLLDPPQKTKNSPVPFSRALRRLFVAYRKKLIKPKIITEKVEVVKEVPVEVIKEVPVDKIVFKDIPKEIIRKEIVHVPLYTNDKRLLNEEELNQSKVNKSKVKKDPLDKKNGK